MNVTKKDNYTLIQPEASLEVTKVVADVDAVAKAQFTEDNVVVDLLHYDQLSLAQLLLFLETSNRHRNQKKSFVLINTALESDTIPYELIVVPTLQEAEDIIEMEDIERDLGF